MNKEALVKRINELEETIYSDPQSLETELYELNKIASINHWYDEQSQLSQMLAYSYYFQGRNTDAIRVGREGLGAAEIVGNKQRRLYCANVLSVILVGTSHHLEAIEILLGNLEEARRIAPLTLLATYLHNLVLCFDFLDDERSYDYLAELYMMIPNLKEDVIINGIYDTICFDYLKLGEYDEALRVAEEWRAMDLSNDISWQLQRNICFAKIFLHLERFTESEIELIECLKIARELHNTRYIAKALLYQSQIRILGEKWDDAQHLLEEALPYAEQDKYTYLQCKQFLSRCLAHNKRFHEAIASYKSIITEASQSFAYILPEVYLDLAAIFVLQKKYELAYQYIIKHNQFNEKKNSRKRKAQISNIRVTLAVEQEKHARELAEIKLTQSEILLANNALLLASQSELLGNFRNDLRQIVRDINEPIEALKKIKEKLKTLPCEQIDWMKFEGQFIAVHPEFKAKLIEKFPELTPQETRICLLLRVGMKSYEIGRIICVSERGVENHRFNIRKKLGLKKEQSLIEFLQSLK